MGRRRVLIVCSHFPPLKSGEAAHTQHLAERLAAAGVDVHVLTSAAAGRPAAAGYTLHRSMTGWGWRGLPTLLRVIRRTRPDAVLTIYTNWIYSSHPMATTLPVVGRLAAPRARFVTQFEHVQEITLCWPWAVRQVLRRLRTPGGVAALFGPLFVASDRLAFLCDQHREIARRFAPRAVERAAVIPAPPILTVLPAADGQTRRQGRERVGVPADGLVFTYFGFIYPDKGVETLLRAVAAAAARLGPFRLVLVGGFVDERYGAELKRLANDLGLERVVVWAGFCEPEDASRYLHASDLCVFPFNLGVQLNNSSFAVAAAHRLPVLTTAGAAVEPQFVHADNVWLVPPGDPSALAEAVERLAADPALRERLRAGVARLADQCFSWDRVVADTQRLLFD